MSLFVNLSRIILNNGKPLEDVSKKAKFFLMPQISYIEETYGNIYSNENKYSAVGIASIGFTIAIAEELSKHRISHDKRIQCLLEIYGDDYKDLFIFLFSIFGNKQDCFTVEIEDSRQLAVEDVKNGMINGSNYLITHGDGLMAKGGNLEVIYKDIINYWKYA